MTTKIKEKKMKELKNKVETKAKEVGTGFVDFVGDHVPEIIYGTLVVGGLTMWGLALHKVNKESKGWEAAWRLANDHMKNNDTDFDYGPYKLMKFFEPKTGELIGQMACHEDTVKAFLEVK